MSSHRLVVQAVALVAALSFTACGGGSGGGGSGDGGAPTTTSGTPSGGSPSAGTPPGATPDPVTVTGLEITPNAVGGLNVPVGTSTHFSATATYSDGSSGDVTGEVTWASSNASAAEFSTVAGVLDPLAAGTTVVSATHPGGLAAQVDVAVLGLAFYVDPADPTASPLVISPENPTILVDTTVQFQVSAILSDLSVVDYTGNVIWTSSDETIATISPTGQATAGAVVGQTTITATDPVTGVSDSTTLTVTDVPAALGYILLSRGSVIGGSANPVTGTVVLTSKTSPAQSVTIDLWTSPWKKNQISYDPAPEADVPASVIVDPNSDRVTFAVTHHAVTKRTRIAVYAKDENQTPAIVKRASLWVRPAR